MCRRFSAEVGAERVGVMLAEGLERSGLSELSLFEWGRWSAPEELAQRLYAGMRELDSRNCAVIVCPVPEGDGIAAALRDRLSKAAK